MNGINPSNFITQFVPWVAGANEVGPKARTYTLLIQADQTGVSEALQGEFLLPDICFNFSKALSLYRSSNSWLSHLHRNTSSHLGRTDGHLLKIWLTSYGTVPAGLSLIPGVQLKQEPPRSYESIKVQPCNSHISMKTPGYLFQAVLIQ